MDPFKAFARKIAAQFTPEDISAVHYLANIPERVQSKLSTGVALINYLTNSRFVSRVTYLCHVLHLCVTCYIFVSRVSSSQCTLRDTFLLRSTITS